MNGSELLARLRASLGEMMPLPGGGQTAARHRRLMQIGRENLSLARLAEGHWDAVAILAEAGRAPAAGALYAVWASEIPNEPVSLDTRGSRRTISGKKTFCSGAGLVDHALVTVGLPDRRLIDIDLRATGSSVQFDDSEWKTTAFKRYEHPPRPSPQRPSRRKVLSAPRAGICKEQASGTVPVALLRVGPEAPQDWSIGRWSKNAMTLTRSLILAPCSLLYGPWNPIWILREPKSTSSLRIFVRQEYALSSSVISLSKRVRIFFGACRAPMVPILSP